MNCYCNKLSLRNEDTKCVHTLHGQYMRKVAHVLTFFFPMFPLIPLKTTENLWFSDVFRGIKREHWEEKG